MNTKTETQLEFDFDPPNIEWHANSSYFINSPTPLFTITPKKAILFHSGGKEVGQLDWEDGKMKFTGNAEESAKLFFDNIIGIYTKSNT